jgi:hypothetical protein
VCCLVFVAEYNTEIHNQRSCTGFLSQPVSQKNSDNAFSSRGGVATVWLFKALWTTLAARAT